VLFKTKRREKQQQKQKKSWGYYSLLRLDKSSLDFHLDHVNGAIAEEIGLRRDGGALDVLLLTSEAKREIT
jgi:hypothetical protein